MSNHDFDKLDSMEDNPNNTNDPFIDLLKKTKRKTILRNLLISVLSSIVVIVILVTINQLLLAYGVSNALHSIQHFKLISGPNINMSEYRQNDGLFEGIAEFNTYKMVDGVPIPWKENKIRYNILGNFSRFAGSYSQLQVGDSILTPQFQYSRPYNDQNGQREMLFYHPSVQYDHYLDERKALDEIEDRKKVEMAISFDRPYSIEQINTMLPKTLHPAWYWVDTYSKDEIMRMLQSKEQMPELTYEVYGLEAYYDRNNNIGNTEGTFLEYIKQGLEQRGKYYSAYSHIYETLKNNKAIPTISDVKIIGVVVTGDVDEMRELDGQSYVKTAILGAITEKY